MNTGDTEMFPCPCCGFLTRDETAYGSFDICPVCFWEDDDVQALDPDFAGGANDVSLNEARENFKTLGAVEARLKRYTRPPRADEIPDRGLLE